MLVDPVDFYVGLHQPSDAHRFPLACISIRRLWGRKKPIVGTSVLVDSGAFMELLLHGHYRESVETYAAELHRLHSQGIVNIAAAVTQDYMCEPFMLLKTAVADGLPAYSVRWVDRAIKTDDDEGAPVRTEPVKEAYLTPGQAAARLRLHQDRTIKRYDALVAALDRLFGGPPPFPVMPVLQGYAPTDYVRHAHAYGPRLARGMWVGVGSVCKRNSSPTKIADVARPLQPFGFRLHGFGVKLTALLSSEVRDCFATADSMAWSFAARKQGRSPNSWQEAEAFVSRITGALALPRRPYQMQLL